MKRRYWPLFGIVGTAIVACAWNWANTMPPRLALPWSATDIQDDLITAGFLPDFWYVMKARIPEADFAPYVERLQLKPLASARQERSVIWNCSQAPWWNPTLSMERAWYRGGKDWAIYAKYEAGWLYVFSYET